MTLIAAFKRAGGTALFADARLTTASGAERHPARKLHILRPSLAVSWTGHRGAAESVFHHLRRHLKPHPTFDNIEYLLTLFPPKIDADLRVTLVGAYRTIETDIVFQWKSDAPKYVAKGDYFAGGTGAKEVLWLLKKPAQVATDTGRGAELIDAFGMVSHLAALDFRAKLGHAKDFGFAYEVARYNNGAFEYVPSVRYFSALLTLDANAQLQSPPIFNGGFLSVFSRPEVALVERWEAPAKDSALRAALFDVDDSSDGSYPPQVQQELGHVEPRWLLPHSYTCLAALIRDPRMKHPQPAAFSQAGELDSVLRVVTKPDTYDIGFDAGFVVSLYDQFRSRWLSET